MNLALGVVAPVLVAYEMFRFFEETLTPRTVMATKFITLGVALAALALDVFAHIKSDIKGKYTILALIIGSIFMYAPPPFPLPPSPARDRTGANTCRISSLIPALYALRNHRRLAAYDEISHPTNTKPYGFTDPESQVRLHPSRASIMSTFSDGNARRLSASSLLSIRRTSVAAEEVPLREEPAGVYKHERDTQFEEYVSKRNSGMLGGVEGFRNARGGGDKRNSRSSLGPRDVGHRNSLGAGDIVNRSPLGAGDATNRNSLSPADAGGSSPNLKDTVDRAMKTEFGWGARSGSPSSLGDELGWKGSVGARADVGRVPSSAGHSLDAVPETVEEGKGAKVVKSEGEVRNEE